MTVPNLPTSTYRYQISPRFTLFQAAADLPRLVRLGVDAVYLSPVLQSTVGSDHGYDWVDCRTVDPQRGGEEGWAAFIAAARAEGLKVVLDIVPNHCGISVPEQNPFWWGVLREGRQSAHAHWFDIDWSQGPILVPILPVDGDLSGLTLSDDLTQLRLGERRLPVAPGTAAVGDDPAAVAGRQHYRLAPWPSASTELNYRRFFTVETLAGLRIEDEDVFTAVHERIFRMVDEGQLQGLRVDHPDGLTDPTQYFQRLRARVGNDLWLLAEKILGDAEPMPDWPVDGTSGYDAIAELTRVFTDPAAEEVLTSAYVDLTGDHDDVDAHIIAGKRMMIENSFGSEVARILRGLPADVRGGGASEVLRPALVEIALRVPVYRSYLPDDPAPLLSAISATRSALPHLEPGIAALEAVLTDAGQESARRLEQLTGALTAKGLEDTAWYRYARYIGANEVGGHPGRFATSVEEFHADQGRRQRLLPHSMTALSTHDTKRGEDVRATLAAMTEFPVELIRWSMAFQSAVDIPDRPFAHFLAQTLAAVGPVEQDRLHAYATKAMREASTSTSWANPDVEFERHVHAAIEMAYSDSRVTTQWMGLRVQILAAGLSNSIAQKLVQLTLPGIPDVYQGTEIIDDSLVDPDNRRLPDATRLAAAASSPALGHHPDPDQVKHWVVQHALALRRRRPQAFTSYTPVILQGPLREHLIGFDRGGAVTLATRLPQGLAAAGGWGEAALSLDGAWTNLLTGQTAAGRVRLADVFATLPVALLVQG